MFNINKTRNKWNWVNMFYHILLNDFIQFLNCISFSIFSFYLWFLCKYSLAGQFLSIWTLPFDPLCISVYVLLIFGKLTDWLEVFDIFDLEESTFRRGDCELWTVGLELELLEGKSNSSSPDFETRCILP